MVLWRKSHFAHQIHSSLCEKKNAVYYFQSCFCSRDIRKKANWWRITLNPILIKYEEDVSANLYLKYLILCKGILLNMLQNTSLSLVAMATYWDPNLTNISGFLATFGVSFWYLLMVPHMHVQQASEYDKSSSWPRLMFFELKITNVLKSSGWGLEKSELPWKQNF